MEHFRLISRVVSDSFNDLNQVDYEDLRSHLMQSDLLAKWQFSELDALHTRKKRNEKLFFEYAPTLGSDRFLELIDIIDIDHPHVSRKVRQVFQQRKQSQSPVTSESCPDKASLPAQSTSPKYSAEMAFTDMAQPISTPENFVLTGNECTEDVRKFFERYRGTSVDTTHPKEIEGNEFARNSAYHITQERARGRNVNNQMSVDSTRPKEVYFTETDNNYSTETYRMDTNLRGVAFIINNCVFDNLKTRSGSNADRDNLCRMFKYLGWQVTTKNNLTAQEMDQYLKKFARHASLEKASAIAVAILSHGFDDDIYFGKDGKLNHGTPVSGTFINRFELMQNFGSSVCTAMSGKPKWFIIQACRGLEEDIKAGGDKGSDQSRLALDGPTRAPYPNMGQSPQKRKEIPETGDMCFFFASSKGYKAYRMLNSGSPVLQILRQTVEEESHRTEFTKIMQMVRKKLYEKKLPGSKMTLPEFSSQLINDWYLNPPRLL